MWHRRAGLLAFGAVQDNVGWKFSGDDSTTDQSLVDPKNISWYKSVAGCIDLMKITVSQKLWQPFIFPLGPIIFQQSIMNHDLSILWRSFSECIRKKSRYIMTWSFFVFLTLEMCKRNIRAGESYEMSQITIQFELEMIIYVSMTSSTLVPKVASTSKMVCMIRSSFYVLHQLRNIPHENVWLIQPTRWNTCHILFGFWMIDDPKMPGRSSHANLTTAHPLSITQTLGGVPQFGLRWSFWKNSLMLVSWHECWNWLLLCYLLMWCFSTISFSGSESRAWTLWIFLRFLGGVEQKQQDDCEKSQRRCNDVVVVDYSLHS